MTGTDPSQPIRGDLEEMNSTLAQMKASADRREAKLNEMIELLEKISKRQDSLTKQFDSMKEGLGRNGSLLEATRCRCSKRTE